MTGDDAANWIGGVGDLFEAAANKARVPLDELAKSAVEGGVKLVAFSKVVYEIAAATEIATKKFTSLLDALKGAGKLPSGSPASPSTGSASSANLEAVNTAKQVAAYMKISAAAVGKLASEGKLEAMDVKGRGGARLFSREAVESFVEGKPAEDEKRGWRAGRGGDGPAARGPEGPLADVGKGLGAAGVVGLLAGGLQGAVAGGFLEKIIGIASGATEANKQLAKMQEEVKRIGAAYHAMTDDEKKSDFGKQALVGLQIRTAKLREAGEESQKAAARQDQLGKSAIIMAASYQMASAGIRETASASQGWLAAASPGVADTLTQSVEMLSRAFGDVLAPHLLEIAFQFQSAATFVRELTTEYPVLSSAIGYAAAAMTGLALAGQFLGPVFSMLKVAVGGVATAFVAARTAVVWLYATISAHPLGAVITGVGLLTASVVALAYAFRQSADAAGQMGSKLDQVANKARSGQGLTSKDVRQALSKRDQQRIWRAKGIAGTEGAKNAAKRMRVEGEQAKKALETFDPNEIAEKVSNLSGSGSSKTNREALAEVTAGMTAEAKTEVQKAVEGAGVGMGGGLSRTSMNTMAEAIKALEGLPEKLESRGEVLKQIEAKGLPEDQANKPKYVSIPKEMQPSFNAIENARQQLQVAAMKDQLEQQRFEEQRKQTEIMIQEAKDHNANLRKIAENTERNGGGVGR